MPTPPTYVIGRFEVDIRVEEAADAFVTDTSCFSTETNAYCSISLQANVPAYPQPVGGYEPIPGPEPMLGATLAVGIAALVWLKRFRVGIKT